MRIVVFIIIYLILEDILINGIRNNHTQSHCINNSNILEVSKMNEIIVMSQNLS